MERMTIPAGTLTHWRVDPRGMYRVAADLVSQIDTGQISRYAGLPDNQTLASRNDASIRSVIRAKEMLADRYRYLIREDGRYYLNGGD
jgi:hypothetical protein